MEEPTKKKKFQFPQQLINKINDLSGSADKNKGFILFVVDSEGEPIMLMPSEMETSVALSLRKCAEISLDRMNEMDVQGYLMQGAMMEE